MLTSFVTNGYLNLLSIQYYGKRCRRVYSCVLTTLRDNLRRNGGNYFNEDTDFGLVLPGSGCTYEDVRTAALVFIPVFMGATEGGHSGR
jgi:hypothetical protein